jgi:hypothetical protein
MAAQDLTTLANVRSRLELPTADTSRDSLIAALITSASDAIMREVEREFAPATASATRRRRVYPHKRVDGNLYVDLAPYDLRTVASMSLDPESSSPTTLTATTDYVLGPVEAPQAVYTHVLLRHSISPSSTLLQNFGFAYLDIAGAWGFASVPTDVAEACIETVKAWLRRDSVAFGLDLDDGSGLAPQAPGTYSLPNSALKKLAPFRRSIAF